MAERRPQLVHGSLSARFPLAARALRPSAAPVVDGVIPSTPAVAARQPTATPMARGRNNWMLYVFLLLLPLQNIQFGYLPRLEGGLNFLNVMFALSLIGAWSIGGKLARGEPLNAWIGAYAAYAVVSLLIGYQYVDAEEHLAFLKDHLIGLFVFYLVQMSVQDWSGVRRIILVTLLPLPYMAKVIWVQHQSVSRWHYSDDLRIAGTFVTLNANELAAFCATVAIVLFALLIAARLSKVWKLALLGGIAAMVMGVLYAYSRTGYVSLMLGLVTVILAWRGRWKMLLPLLLVAAFLPSMLPYSVVERFDSTTMEASERDKSTEMRFEYWKVGWRNFLAHPVAGTGFHSFHHREINPHGTDTHNLYIRTLAEGGLIGGTLLLGLLLAVFQVARRELANASNSLHYALALGLVGAWMALICGNLFGDRFTYYPMIGYFWAYAALVVKARHLPPEVGGR